ncbi:MAG: aminotransferase class III-fold pyridoxal phosphate-dependent enzyme, partial [Euryarchaeota archaeon]|nr:aminotransferase class III-fold pyridoxal phosphate-dependent enzyme [Euryarchaeota archaeon]
AFEHSGIMPDIVTLAKALGGGYPIGAIVSSDEISKAFSPGTHGSTFGGNPFVCAVARTAIETIVDDGLDRRARDLGERWISRLRSLSSEKAVSEVRGKGLMIGIEMPDAAKEFQRYAFERRVLVNVCAGKVVRLVPPLIISEDSIARFDGLLAEFLNSRS